MSTSPHIADADLALYAVGALPMAEWESARAHLASCAQCREELRRNMLAVAGYAQATPESTPPAGARERFMATLSDTPKPAPQPNAQPQTVAAAEPAKPDFRKSAPSKSPSSWLAIFSTGWAMPALAGALAILLVLVGIDDLRKRAEIGPLLTAAQRGAVDSAQLSQLMELLTSPQAQKVALHQTPAASPPPEGRVVYSAHSGKLLLTAQNLRPLPAGKAYELWILQPGGKKPLPAGTFWPDGSGNAAMMLADEPANLAVAGFGVTIENASGAQTPTMPIVLSGL